MELREITATSFVLLQADWSAGNGRLLITQSEATHVIVRGGGADEYYLYDSTEARHRLEQIFGEATIGRALQLETETTTSVVDGSMAAEEAPDRCIVVSNGQLLGFFDATAPPPPNETSRRVSPTVRSSRPVPTRLTKFSSLRWYLEATLPDTILIGETSTLRVSILSVPEKESPLAPTPRIDANLDILTWSTAGIDIQGPSRSRVAISGNQEPPPLLFRLTGTVPGAGQLRVLAFQSGRLVSLLTMRVVVSNSNVRQADARRSDRQSLELSSVHPTGSGLTLLVDLCQDAEGKALRFMLATPGPDADVLIRQFEVSAPSPNEVSSISSLLESLVLPYDNHPAARVTMANRLEAFGARLSQRFLPPSLEAELCSLKGTYRQLHVVSDGFDIPWELCRFAVSREEGRPMDGPFMGEAFNISRWLLGTPPQLRLTLQRIAVATPGLDTMSGFSSDVNGVPSLLENRIQVTHIPATLVDLHRALSSGEYDAWYVSGHHVVVNDSSEQSFVQLPGGERVTPESLGGMVGRLDRSHPIVFVNAAALQAWPRAFLGAGAAAYISTYWPVADTVADKFARTFFGALLRGLPIGRAIESARRTLRHDGDPNWLAYVVYADPLAEVLPGGGP